MNVVSYLYNSLLDSLARREIELNTRKWLGLTTKEPQMKFSELCELVRLIKERDPKIVVEIGCFNGATSRVMAEALQLQGSKGSLFCIDPFEVVKIQDYAQDRYNATVLGYDYEKIFDNNIKPLKDRIVKLKGYSDEVAMPENIVADMVFIDGDHSQEGVRKDIERFAPLVAKGGVLCFHDVTIGRRGVLAALLETIWPAPNSEYYFIVSHIDSLLIIQKK